MHVFFGLSRYFDFNEREKCEVYFKSQLENEDLHFVYLTLIQVRGKGKIGFLDQVCEV